MVTPKKYLELRVLTDTFKWRQGGSNGVKEMHGGDVLTTQVVGFLLSSGRFGLSVSGL